MEINQNFVDEITKLLPPHQFFIHEMMSKHTTFKIGGPADYLIFPASIHEVTCVFDLLRKYSIPFTVLGNGSNVLVLDKGIRGAVVKFNSPMSDLMACKSGKLEPSTWICM